MQSNPWTTLVHSFATPGGEPRLGVLAKRAYRLEPGKVASALPGPCPIRTETEVTLLPERRDRELIADADLPCFLKTVTDVLVSGSAHTTRGPATVIDCGVQIGGVRRTARVTGDRTITGVRGAAVEASAPERFTSMPLTWQRAYGGRDLRAEELLYGEARRRRRGLETMDDAIAHSMIAYPRNRWGSGYFVAIEVERLVGERLPNFSDAEDPVTPERLLAADPFDWERHPAAAGFGPIDAFTFPRCMFYFLQPELQDGPGLREIAVGALRLEDLRDRDPVEPPDPRYYNSAPPGLAVARLAGNEPIALWNLHPELERCEVQLPGDRPKLIVEPPNTRAYELEATLGTVWIKPDEGRIELTWAGSMPVAAVFPAEMCKAMRHTAV